jgi:hypothetical protein
VFDQLVREPPASPQPTSGIFLHNGGLFDHCQGIELKAFFTDVIPIADQDFSTTRDGATLGTTINATDAITGAPLQLSINLTWTCTEPATQSVGHTYVREPGSIVTSRFRGLLCPAQAAGTLSDGASNFTPAPSAYAALLQAGGSFVKVMRLPSR